MPNGRVPGSACAEHMIISEYCEFRVFAMHVPAAGGAAPAQVQRRHGAAQQGAPTTHDVLQYLKYHYIDILGSVSEYFEVLISIYR